MHADTRSACSSIFRPAAVAMVALALLATAPAALASGAAVERPLKGSCETTFVPADVQQGPPVQVLEITLTCRLTHLGLTGGAAIQQVDFGQFPFAITATIVYVAANGDELYATFAGSGVPSPDGLNVAFAGATVYDGGTGRFANASGWSLDTGSASLPTSSGALTLNGKLTY